MLTFRNTNLFFTGLLVVTIAANFSYIVPWYIYLIILFSYSLILFYGCYYIGSNFFLQVICYAETSEKVISISFDDGPVVAGTPEILQVLQDNDIKAAFFCIGNRIPSNETILKQIDAEGHLIGNHSFSHAFWFDMLSADAMIADLKKMDGAMHHVIGRTPKLFRPPYGVINPNLKKAIVAGNYTPIGWSVRSMDTVIKDPAMLLGKVMKGLKPGAIFLFHDTGKATITMLPAFIKQVHAAGYRIERLDKMLNLQAYA